MDKYKDFTYHFPYLEVNQNKESIYLTKIPVSILSKLVNFHFRISKSDDKIDADKYIKKLEKIGIESKAVEEGIQRRTDLKRIKDISTFATEAEGIIFPTPIVLSLNIFEGENESIEDYYVLGEHEIFFKDNIEFTIIDGQHRLAGLVDSYNSNKIQDIEMPVTLILGADISVASKMFIDINGNQRKVNRSVIYDLLENIDSEELEYISKFSRAVKGLNNKGTSPLYNRIKILGTGKGTVSQAFMTDYLIDCFAKETNLSSQDIYSNTFIYFKIISEVYSKYWNKKNEKGLHDSFIVKTNGIGALLLFLKELVSEIGLPIDNRNVYRNLFETKSNFPWDSDKYFGTGKKVQNQIKEDLSEFYNFDKEKNDLCLRLFIEKANGEKTVPEKSGLNQWNAGGRVRNPNEVYIPYPVLDRNKGVFFPGKDISFELELPNNETISAKVCQQDGKAIMSNPNSTLGKWLLRDVLKISEGDIVTFDLLKEKNVESLIFTKINDSKYKVRVGSFGSYNNYK